MPSEAKKALQRANQWGHSPPATVLNQRKQEIENQVICGHGNVVVLREYRGIIESQERQREERRSKRQMEFEFD